MSNEPIKTSAPAPEDWGIARPEKTPRPTLYPPVVAFGATLLVWGLISSLIITAFGAVLFVIGLGGWIAEIRHERKS